MSGCNSCGIDRKKCRCLLILVFGALCICLIHVIPNNISQVLKPYMFVGNNQRDNQHQISGQNGRIDREDLPLCPEIPDNLVTKIHVEQRLREIKRDPSILQNVLPGGTYIPPHCKSRGRLALLIPYRDREEHLKKFIPYMHAFLQKQQVHYTIFVAEMMQGTVFNIGLMQNIAFVTADKTDNFTCFVFNDVDLFPTNENNVFRCADVPIHHCHINSKYGNKLFYQRYFGGSVAMTREQLFNVNGFSNLYFGWGSEDDDILQRIIHVGYKWTRVPKDIGVYEAIKHEADKGNPYNFNRFSLNNSAIIRMNHDGLNSLNYIQVALEQRPLYTWILADVNKTEITKNYTHLFSDKKGP